MQAPATAPSAAESGADVPTSFGTAAPTSASLRRAPWRRVSAGHLVMVLAGLVGAALTLVALRSGNETSSVAVASRDFLAGQELASDALEFVEVRVDDEMLDRLVVPDDESALDGHVFVQPVAEGDLVARSDLAKAAAPAGRRAVSVPVEQSRAVAGALGPGDRVDVVYVVDGEPTYAATDAEVLDVHHPDRGAIGGGIDAFSVTIAVDDEAALEVARGIEDGTIVVVRATGADPIDEVVG